MVQEISELINVLAASEGGLMFGLMAMMVVLVFSLVIYVYSAIAIMAIAKKTKTENGWLAWIPIANIYLITQIAKQPAWQMLGILLVLIPFIGTLLLYVLLGFWFWHIAERLKKPSWLGILMAIPVVNLVILGYLAWSK